MFMMNILKPFLPKTVFHAAIIFLVLFFGTILFWSQALGATYCQLYDQCDAYYLLGEGGYTQLAFQGMLSSEAFIGLILIHPAFWRHSQRTVIKFFAGFEIIIIAMHLFPLLAGYILG